MRSSKRPVPCLMPVGEKSYSQISLSPAILGEPVVGIYFGCGRTPAGPRLRAAYEAVGADKLSPLPVSEPGHFLNNCSA